VSKPPDPDVSELIRIYAATLATPVQFALLGPGQPDLTAAAEAAVRAVGSQVPAWPSWPQPVADPPRPGVLRGMFSGGTLCDEAMAIAAAALGPVFSNIPLQPEWALPADLRSNGHAMIDFGDDQLTRGRPHPMIDGSLRLERLAQEAADPHTTVVLLDVILGYGAHPDPAADLTVAIRAARKRASDDGRRLDVVISLCGTAGDPQDLTSQAIALQQAGAAVFLSNASAARYAVSLISLEVHA
jgi:FdrA protein